MNATATQRIIELSQPRKDRDKDRRFKSSTRKTQIHRSCSSKIRDLSTSKEVNHNAKAKRFALSGKDKSEMTNLFQGLLR